ncbi:MAG TPA: DUF4836 family protein [Chitinophagaceae bacterium]|nr:DUF4836 family protein [Chitinophagaceae bacterium]
MKNFIVSVSVFFTVAIVLSSCSSKGPKEAKLIPKDASFVMVVDAGSLKNKLQAANINIDSIINKIFEQDSSQTKHKQILKEFQENIVWNEKFFVFTTSKKISSTSQGTSFSLIAPIKDSAKLYAFIHKQDEMKDKKVVHEKKYSYMQVGNDFSLSWTDKNVIATFYHVAENKRMTIDSVVHVNEPESINKIDELKKQVDAFYTQSESESLASVSLFMNLFKEKADAYTFSGSSSFTKYLSMMPVQLPKLEDLLKDNFTTSTFSFEDGKITAKSSFYPNKTLSAIFKKYSGPTVNLSMIENYPSQNINGFLLASVNPQVFNEILKELDVDALANTYLEKLNISSDDLFKCLKGDIAVAFSDLSPEKFSGKDASAGKEPPVKLIFNAAVGDKKSFDKIMQKAVDNGLLVKQNHEYKAGGLLQIFGIYVHVDDKNLIVASDSLTYAQYVSKTGKANISSDVINQIKDKPSAAYINIESIISGFNKNKIPSGDSIAYATAKNTFKDIIATSSNYDGTKIASEFNLRLKNEKQNSLVTLMSLFTNFSSTYVKNHQNDDSFEHLLLLDPSMGNF